jgi:hypothetical protein
MQYLQERDGVKQQDNNMRHKFNAVGLSGDICHAWCLLWQAGIRGGTFPVRFAEVINA